MTVRLASASLLTLSIVKFACGEVPFEASFSNVETIGSSNYTHFWMPTPLSRLSASSTAPLYVHVDLCGDGGKCPPPGHPQPSAAYFEEPNDGGAWSREAMHMAANALIRLNSTATRGLGSIVLDAATNISATVTYNDWVVSDSAGTIRPVMPGKLGKATVTGLPPMLQIAYFQSTPCATLINADGSEVVFAQFYGYSADATKIGGCISINPHKCYSTFTLASMDKGDSWHYRSAITWDAERMPADVEGPCEPTLITLPDGKTLLSIFRLNSNQNLWQATSSDQGRTWSPARKTSAWAVFPQAKTLASGALVLTSGRPGIGLWLADGRGVGPAGPDPTSWKYYNLAKEHNNLMGSANHALLYSAPELAVMNASSRTSNPVMTKAYTGLETVGCDESAGTCTLVVSYDRLANGNAGPDPGPGPHGAVDAAFTMRVTVRAI